MAYVKCSLYEINKNSLSANAAHGPSLVQKMLRERTEAMSNQSGPKPGPDCSNTNDSCNYKAVYTVNHKNRDILFLFITLANLKRLL